MTTIEQLPGGSAGRSGVAAFSARHSVADARGAEMIAERDWFATASRTRTCRSAWRRGRGPAVAGRARMGDLLACGYGCCYRICAGDAGACRREVLGPAVGSHEFVKHAVECAEPDRKMTLSLLEVRRGGGKV
jgi:hypothetical protein